MSDTNTPPDVLVRTDDGKVYYAPGSSLQPVKVPAGHPVHALLDQAAPGPAGAHVIAGRFAQHHFASDDGQGASN
jgi:hypothetical protein